MKRLKLVLAGIALFLTGHLAAQQTLITGVLRDATTQSRLPGATVQIEGTTEGSVTDLNGQFVLRTNRSGEVAILLKYIGFETKKITVTLTPGQETHIEETLSHVAGELSEVVITENLQGNAKALNQQRSSGVIVNVVAADQIGRFPDPNAAEALQRVQGVNIERDQGEGRYVLVRGLAPQFTNVNINGEQIPSPEASVRYVALDAIPSDQLASMEIYKTLQPDLDGDAIGGSVNLITRTATSSDPVVRASAVLGYNNLMNEPNGQGSLQYGQRFLDNKLGVMLNTSYYVNNLGSHNWERDTDGDISNVEEHLLELRDYELTRTRTGLSGTIDYKFNNQNEIYFRSMYNRFTDREWRRRYVFAPVDAEVEQLVKDRFEEQTISSFNLGGRHEFERFSLNYEGAIANAEQDTPYDNEIAFVAGDMESSIDFSRNDFPGLSTNPSYLNNDLFEFNEFETGATLAKDQNITGKFNVIVPYRTGESSGELKFGSKVRFKEKSFAIEQNVYEAISGVPNADAFLGGRFSDNFLDGQYTLNQFPDVGNFINFFNANPERFELQIEDKIVDEALEAFEAEEDVYAGYAMTTHRFKKLTLIGGLRYEYTTVNYRSQEVTFDQNDELSEIRNIEGSTSYGFVLPQLNLRYALTDKTILRGAATLSYSRPNFEDIIPAQEANLRDREASVGNPDLLPVSAFNLDAFAEHYMDNLGLLSGGVYYKQLSDFIYTRRFQAPYPLNSQDPLADEVNFVQAQNGEQANLFGLEFGFQRQLDFLPGILKNLGLFVNYTFTSSDAQFQRTDDSRLESVRLPGQAAHVGNFSLAYNDDKISVRAALNLNGEYLTEIGATANDDIYVNGRLQFDVTAGYRITKNWRVFAEVINLTNQPFELYSGSSDSIIQREFYSWWSRIGVKFDLN